MEHAKWNEQEINAADIAENIELECKIREVSSKELFCPDPECENPILRYCRGEKKRAYFAHLHNSNCDYAQFDRLPSLIRELRYKLFDIFESFFFAFSGENEHFPVPGIVYCPFKQL